MREINFTQISPRRRHVRGILKMLNVILSVTCMFRLFSIPPLGSPFIYLKACSTHTIFSPLSSAPWRDISCSRNIRISPRSSPTTAAACHPRRHYLMWLPRGKGPTIILRFSSTSCSLILGAHLSIRCCFDNETWFEWGKREEKIPPWLWLWSSRRAVSELRRSGRNKSNIIFNFRARSLCLTAYTAVLAPARTRIPHKRENHSEIPRLRVPFVWSLSSLNFIWIPVRSSIFFRLHRRDGRRMKRTHKRGKARESFMTIKKL